MTRCYSKKCQILPKVVQKVTTSVLLKFWCFSKQPKRHQIFGLNLQERIVTKSFQKLFNLVTLFAIAKYREGTISAKFSIGALHYTTLSDVKAVWPDFISGRFYKFLFNKFSGKSSPNISKLFWLLRKTTFKSNCHGYFWGNFWVENLGLLSISPFGDTGHESSI